MLFSIITVSYNNSDMIKKTLDSLIKQTFKDYELIVVDGGSTDNSNKYFEDYEGVFEYYTHISEKDSGIYDAMNKGVKIAKGEYIYFLNLGDMLYDSRVLENVAKYIIESHLDLYYGDVFWGKERIVQPNRLNEISFLMERMICHQSIFASKRILEQYPFDLELKICADRNWLLTCYRNKVKYKKIDVIIAYYDTEGKSSNYIEYNTDSLRTIKKSFGVIGVIIVKIKRKVGKIVKG